MLSAEQANRRYFREAYETGQHGWPGDAPSPYVVAFLERLKDSMPGGSLLDVGCGEGRHSVVAARLGFKVTAVDYERLALKRAREFAEAEGADGIAFHSGNVFSLPFRASHFDIVLDYGCLHHQKKSRWPSYTASILRVLKPQGFYVLSVFSPRFRLFRGSKRRWHIAHGAYRRCFTADEIASLFGRHFEIVEMVEERGEGRGFWHALMRRRPAT
ncbi:MAG: class I SAM-dependent methyltransferase [Planctomycetota bacterium]